MLDAGRGRSRALAAGVIVFATAVSLALRLNSPTYLLPRLAEVVQSKGHPDMADDTALVADGPREPLHR
jgi:hypothetical protein